MTTLMYKYGDILGPEHEDPGYFTTAESEEGAVIALGSGYYKNPHQRLMCGMILFCHPN